VRRIEAISGKESENFVNQLFYSINDVKEFLKSPNILPALQKLIEENEKFRKSLETFAAERVSRFIELIDKLIEQTNGYHIICHISDLMPDMLKQAAYKIRNYKENLIVVLGSNHADKPSIVVALSDDLIAKGLNAAVLIREVSPLIQGGGGGQPELATAGGKNSNGLEAAMKKVLELVNLKA
jgi:alanyl-tRNA synthetase